MLEYTPSSGWPNTLFMDLAEVWKPREKSLLLVICLENMDVVDFFCAEPVSTNEILLDRNGVIFCEFVLTKKTTPNHLFVMAIAPITGTLRRKIIFDITAGFGCGFVLATAYWYLEHKPVVAKREAYYAQLKAQKEAEDAA